MPGHLCQDHNANWEFFRDRGVWTTHFREAVLFFTRWAPEKPSSTAPEVAAKSGTQPKSFAVAQTPRAEGIGAEA